MNMRFGKNLFGRWRFGQAIKAAGGGGDTPVSSLPLAPGEFSLRVYGADGTKTAEFGSGVGDNAVGSFSFEITTSGCGKLDFTLGVLPPASVLNYGSRVDVHLFNDSSPWYSGYIIQKPVAGSTIKPYKFSGHGYVEQLKRIIVDQIYQGMDVASVAKAILQNEIEPSTGITYASNKIIRAGYTVQKLRFDHRSAYDAIKELAEYATDYVWGVDAQRQFFFKPVQETINEQARLFVGVHFDTYEPSESLDDIVNHGFIKGAALDANGSNFMAEVTDAASIAAYGLHQAVLDVPSAVTATDATRWGITEIGKRKNPRRKAKIKNLRLEYPNADGSFNVRRITPEGKAAITTLPMLVESSGALTFARNSIAYRNDGKQVAANEPRFERDLLTGTPLGVKVERTAANILPAAAAQLAGFTNNSNCTFSTSASPDADGFYTITLTATAAGYIRWTGALSVTGAGYFYFVTAMLVSATAGYVCLLDVGARPERTLTTSPTLLALNRPSGHAYPSYYFGFYCSQAGTFVIKAKMPQLEELAYSTSYIPPQVTRASEILSFPTTGMSKNCLDIQISAGPTIDRTAGTYKMIIGAWDCFYLARTQTSALLLSWMDGTQKSDSAYISGLLDNWAVFRLIYDGTTAKVYVDGVEKISVAANFANALPANIAIGQIQSGSGSYPGNCNFRDLLVSRSIRQPGQVQLTNIVPDENTLIYAPLLAGLDYTGQSLQTETHEYPIAKVKYQVQPTGITADLELGEPAAAIADDFKQIYREKKQADHLASLNNLQLKGGSL